jgi:hypothetical protein
VELAVAPAVEAVAVVSPGGLGDRCDAGEACEVCVGGKALGAGDLTDKDGGGERAAAGLSDQLWAVNANEGRAARA